MRMSTRVQAAFMVTILCTASHLLPAQGASPSSWVGVWTSTLGGQPGVTLTLAKDGDQLGGTVVFYVVVGPPPNAHVAGSDVLLVNHPRLDGNTLVFQLNRSSDGKVLQVATRYVDDDKLELRCLNCGGSPTAMLTRSRP